MSTVYRAGHRRTAQAQECHRCKGYAMQGYTVRYRRGRTSGQFFVCPACYQAHFQPLCKRWLGSRCNDLPLGCWCNAIVIVLQALLILPAAGVVAFLLGSSPAQKWATVAGQCRAAMERIQIVFTQRGQITMTKIEAFELLTRYALGFSCASLVVVLVSSILNVFLKGEKINLPGLRKVFYGSLAFAVAAVLLQYFFT